MIDRIHVYDLDGVIIDTSHRYRNKADGTIDLDYWFANRTVEKIARDVLLPLAKQYVIDCNTPNIYTVICTSRSDNALDRNFIAERLTLPNKLIMRAINDSRGDAIIKRNQLKRLFALRQFADLPRKLWEDNLSNIEALRDLFNSCYHIPSTITGK